MSWRRIRETGEIRRPFTLTSMVSLRTRVGLLCAVVVFLASVLMAGAAYIFVARALYNDVDAQLIARADGISALAHTGLLEADPGAIVTGTVFSTAITIAVVKDEETVSLGDVPRGDAEEAVIASTNNPTGRQAQSLRTVGSQRVLARKLDNDSTVILAISLEHTRTILSRLASVLFVAGGVGIIVSVLAGTAVTRTGLRPVTRLTKAAERVARTQELRPISVTGNDELARLTDAFNAMLRALAESRDKQARLVADAGHELKTPLTSLRTNLELLIAASEPGAPVIPAADMVELRSDVMAQIEELSTLVGDLVDLAREDALDTVFEEVAIEDVIDSALERVRRRRSDVVFDVESTPWFVFGEEHGASRAVLNVLDNAAKWSPPGRTVTVTLRQTAPGIAELAIGDAGPGIPPEDRTLVFERFYRADSTRSMPGSGLGLAIAAQVVQRLGGQIWAEQSSQGGALIRMTLPGLPHHTEPEPQVVQR